MWGIALTTGTVIHNMMDNPVIGIHAPCSSTTSSPSISIASHWRSVEQGLNMPDPKINSLKHDREPRLLDSWENEGGSLCSSADRSNPARVDSGLLSVAAKKWLDVLPSGILITCQDGQIIYANPACREMYGMTEAEMYGGTHWLDVIHPQDRKIIEAISPDDRNPSEASVFEARMVNRKNQLLWTRHKITSLTPEQPGHVRIHTIDDISAIKAGEKKVAAAIERLSSECDRARITLDCIGDAVISTDVEGRISYMNVVAEQLTGWSREKAQGLPFSKVFNVIDTTTREPVENPAQRAMNEAGTVQLASNASLLRADGSELEIEDSAAPILNASDQPAGAVVIFRDRRFSQATTNRMSYLAKHDMLTGLSNRVTLMERCEQALKLARRHDGQLALLFIDLDNFKTLNDSMGHKAGDRLLRVVARKLRACVRETDTVSRYGGDEFVILLNEIGDPEDAAKVAGKVLALVRRAFIFDQNIDLDLSIGISLYPRHGVDADTLLCKADAAMYHAKNDSRTHYSFFQPEMLHSNSAGFSKRIRNVIKRTDGHDLHGR